MNYPVIGWVLSWVLKIEGFLLLAPFIISLIYQEKQGVIYLLLAGIAIAAGEIFPDGSRRICRSIPERDTYRSAFPGF